MRNNHLRQLIEDGMRQKGLTQEQLARSIGVASSAITGIRKRGSIPRLDTLKGIATALDIPYDQVLEATGHPIPTYEHTDIPLWLVRVLENPEWRTRIENQIRLESNPYVLSIIDKVVALGLQTESKVLVGKYR